MLWSLIWIIKFEIKWSQQNPKQTETTQVITIIMKLERLLISTTSNYCRNRKNTHFRNTQNIITSDQKIRNVSNILLCL